jgi:hypothetical protein
MLLRRAPTRQAPPGCHPQTSDADRFAGTYALLSFQRARTRRRTSRAGRPHTQPFAWNNKDRNNNNNEERLDDVVRR